MLFNGMVMILFDEYNFIEQSLMNCQNNYPLYNGKVRLPVQLNPTYSFFFVSIFSITKHLDNTIR
jgi:hypothetical protein